jgi:hypothetical protein
MGSTRVGGNEGGPDPPSGEQDKQLTASRGGNNRLMEREEDGKKGQTWQRGSIMHRVRIINISCALQITFGHACKVRCSSLGCSVAQWLARWTVDVQSLVRFSSCDCWFPVLGSIPTQSPPPCVAQEQELPLSEVGPSPGWHQDEYCIIKYV